MFEGAEGRSDIWIPRRCRSAHLRCFIQYRGNNSYLTAHEQGATHAACGYARAAGRPGVVLVTSGPGATNTVTGIADAYMDSVPLVVLTGQVTTNLLGRDSFQEVDIAGITTPITKHNYIVKDAERLPHIIREAFDIATSGRPGPVVVDIPKDVQNAVINYYPGSDAPWNGKPVANGMKKQIIILRI